MLHNFVGGIAFPPVLLYRWDKNWLERRSQRTADIVDYARPRLPYHKIGDVAPPLGLASGRAAIPFNRKNETRRQAHRWAEHPAAVRSNSCRGRDQVDRQLLPNSEGRWPSTEPCDVVVR